MRRISHALLKLIVLSSLILANSTIGLAISFTDLSKNHRDFTSIQFWAENGVLSGYPDGTFRANNKINRVEFLKIVLESSSIPLDVTTETGFIDVDENGWYGPYIKKAKAENWISGYGDNTFQPAKYINMVEGLKIIAEVQQWTLQEDDEIKVKPYEDTPLDAWYIKYVDFGKTNQLIPQRSKLLTTKLLSRADVSSLLHTTIQKNIVVFTPRVVEEEPVVGEEPGTIEEGVSEPEIVADDLSAIVIPKDFRLISEGSFDGITLNSKFPNTFYQDEVYIFSGSIDDEDEEAVLIFVGDSDLQDYENFLGYTDERSNFVIPVVFREPGEHKIGMIPGTVGNSRIFTIKVLPSLPSSHHEAESQAPKNLNINFADDATKISWNKNGNNIFKIKFRQGDETVTYFSRQNPSSITTLYKDFGDFKDGLVEYSIEGAFARHTYPLHISSNWVQGSSKAFQAIQHVTSNIETENISINDFPETISGLQHVTFSGVLTTPSIKKAAIIRPDGLVDRIDLISPATTSRYYSSDIYPPNSPFTFSYTPDISGTYIFEINKQSGAASLNKPMYIGSGIPLLPDFFDSNNNEIDLNPIQDISAARNELLQYVNSARAEFGLDPIAMDNALNQISQDHSQDMAQNNYFSHINLLGLSPSDRRKAANISTEVGENLGKAPSIRYAHEGLMRSAIHRENILDQAWKKVGIGIAKDSTGFYYVTQEFSHNPYSTQDLERFKDETFDAINETRQNMNLTSIAKNETLDTITQTLSNDIKLGQAITSERLSELFSQFNLNKNAFLINGTSPNNQKIMEEAIRKIDSTHNRWSQVGIDYNLDQFGTLIFVILYSS